MSEPILGILKGCLLALMYLFLLRVVMVVASELKGTPQPSGPQPLPANAAGEANGGAPDARKPKPHKASASDAKWTVATIAPPANRGAVIEVRGEITIGRGGGCAISLPNDTFVSTVHARIFEQLGGLWVEDLGSTNGTRLNDEPVKTATQLQDGDRVGVGSTVIEVRR